MATQTPAKPKPAAKPKADPKVALTLSQRRHILILAKARKGVTPANAQAAKPYEYFAANGLAKKTGDTYTITDAGKARAKDIDGKKYAFTPKPKAKPKPKPAAKAKPKPKPASNGAAGSADDVVSDEPVVVEA